MKSLLYLSSALAVMGLAFWAYHENYKTQAALDDVEELQQENGDLLETRAVLRAEWAYLNRPDRLRDLADMNYVSLGLLPLRPEQFGQVDQIAYPPLELKNIVNVVGTRTATPTDPIVLTDPVILSGTLTGDGDAQPLVKEIVP